MGLSFNEAYKIWRNRARHCSAESLISAALLTLHEPAADAMEDLKRAPWNVLLLVKWVCQDRSIDNVRHPVTRDEFDQLRQALWDLPDVVDLSIGETLPFRLFLRQRLHQQLEFQRRFIVGFVREAALLSVENAEHPLKKLFEDKTGLTLCQFLDLSYAVAAEILHGTKSITLAWFERFGDTWGAHTVERFLANISRTLPELRAFCRALPDANEKVVSEYFAFTVLSRYPFLRVGDQFHCWHPAVFFRGMEGFVHSVLSEANSDYIEPFSRLFERHVVAEAQSIGVPLFGESILAEWLPKDTEVPDGLLAYGRCNIFIESKAGIFSESVMTVGHSTMFAHKTKALLKGAMQGWSAATGLHANAKAPPEIAAADINYLLIVTNKELNAGRGTSVASMYPDGKFAPPNEAAKRLLPLEHIYVISIADFERLLAAVRAGDLDLPTFLGDCVTQDSDSQTMVFSLHQHLDRLGIARRSSALVQDAADSTYARLEALVQRHQNP